jgi:hypothetical protein
MTERIGVLGLVLAGSLVACGDSGSVRIDLTELFAHSNQLAQPIDRLTLTAQRAALDSVTVAITPADPVFELDLPAGPLLLEVLGERADGAGFVPTYFGDTRVVVPPSGSTEVTLPAFPAGFLDVTVVIAPEKLPDQAVVAFFARAPRPNQSPVYDAELVTGTLRRVLPAGAYTFRAAVSFNGGRSFTGVGPESAEIVIPHGAGLVETLDLSSL